MDDGARGLSELAKARLARQDGGGIAMDWATYNARKKALAAKVPWGQRAAALYPKDLTKAKKEDVHVSPDGSKVHVVTQATAYPSEQHEFTKGKDGTWQHHTGEKASSGQQAVIEQRLKTGNYTKN